jgi:DNA-binding protein H-NS
MKKLGVSLEDLQSAAPSRAPRGQKKADKAEKGPGSTRPPVPVRFRDPASGDAWTGRGRTPRWLAAHEAQGRSRDEFKVG